ncbi:MAG TPA: thiamine pyrophosphate-binding protein, partial [Thermodesulfobacteriota bacterium]|nr:thiamine pyrophosphate-binding protein [Thermodesulfobacteriota bacterium]
RVARKPGVCLVTAGPGFTNTITGISGAYLANSPLMVISGRSGVEENDRLSLQEIDQQGMAAPVTKWARTVFDTRRIPEYIASAYKKAITGRPGPVYLGMSYEVLYPGCDEGKISAYNTRVPVYKSGAPRETIASLAELLMESKRPVAVAGSGAWYSGAEKSLLDFIEWAKIPLFTLNLGRGIVPDDHPLCLGAASPSAPNGFREITGEADLILLLGVRLSIYIGFGRTFNPRAKIVQIDVDPGEIGRNRPADLGIAGDLATVLSGLTEYMRERYLEPDYPSWLKKAETQWQEKWKEADKLRRSSKSPIHPVRVAKAVEDVMGEDGILVIDGGDTQAFADGYFRVRRPGHYLKGGPLGCMGVGVPFAIGAKAAKPDKQVALITGDGAVGMNFMEFETALRHKLPFVAVVCNDSAWGMTRHQIEITYGEGSRTQGIELGMIPFHEVLRALGGHGELVEKPGDLEPAIERAFSSGVPALVNVVTDPGAVSGATHAITEMMMSANKR